MSILKLTYFPDDPLTQVAKPYKSIGPEVAELADSMFDTMEAEHGVGLAGPQVGVNRRIFVLHDPDEDVAMCFVNPEIFEMSGKVELEEGCLSLPGVYGPVVRAAKIKVHAMDERGRRFTMKASGFLARIIQHEYDHLEGKVFLNRVAAEHHDELMMEWAARRRELLTPPVAQTPDSANAI